MSGHSKMGEEWTTKKKTKQKSKTKIKREKCERDKTVWKLVLTLPILNKPKGKIEMQSYKVMTLTEGTKDHWKHVKWGEKTAKLKNKGRQSSLPHAVRPDKPDHVNRILICFKVILWNGLHVISFISAPATELFSFLLLFPLSFSSFCCSTVLACVRACVDWVGEPVLHRTEERSIALLPRGRKSSRPAWNEALVRTCLT